MLPRDSEENKTSERVEADQVNILAVSPPEQVAGGHAKPVHKFRKWRCGVELRGASEFKNLNKTFKLALHLKLAAVQSR